MKNQKAIKKLKIRTNIRAGGTAVGNPGNVSSMFDSIRRSTMSRKITKTTITTCLIAALLLLTTVAAATTGSRGTASRVTIRDGYSQYEGKIDHYSGSTVTFYYWGGGRCQGVTQPTRRQIDRLLSAHLHGRETSLDYSTYTSNYGTSRCWDGGIQIW